jgi:hypothetical protein
LHYLDVKKSSELESVLAIPETNAMEPIDLLNHPEITRCSMQELNFDGLTLPIQGRDFLEMLRAYIVKNDDCNEVLLAKDFHVSGGLKLERKAKPDSWKSISAFYIDGDLTIEGDLLNDSADSFPFLVVKGDLILRSWLRGGMIAFIGGSIRASGVLVCEYNDGGLFVGGDLIAEGGFIHGMEPYPDMPDVQPHQIRGDIQAKSFDSNSPNITDEQILNTFVTEVLEDVDHCYLQYDPYKIIKRVAGGLSIWRE